MAGGYGHIVDRDGNLMPDHDIIKMLETGGDVAEAVEQLYGMIWYLIYANVKWSGQEKAILEEARRNYRTGLKKAKEVNG